MQKKMIITNGLALFAMFFGAGNIIYPLALGANAGDHIGYVIVAFLISGIGLPFLGLFATSLYHGDYWLFFSRLGKIPAFILIMFLILIIGPLFATPRTATVAFDTLLPFLPRGLNNAYIFNALYCVIVFTLTYRHTQVVDIIGKVLSPIKLVLFTTLIILGIVSTQEILPNPNSITTSIQQGLVDGYSTMDLLATFFFCAIIYRSILRKTQQKGISDPKTIVNIFFYSCVVGAVVLGIVYIGFMIIALGHAAELKNVETAKMIVAISNIVLGNAGSLFVGICVSFACMVTAIALTEVTATFFYETVFQKRIPRTLCLSFIVFIIYLMSIQGFTAIMAIAAPILEVLYPTLIAYCLLNIVLHFRKTRPVIPAKAGTHL